MRATLSACLFVVLTVASACVADANDGESDVDAGASSETDATLYSPCSGEPYQRGTCSQGELCGSLPGARFDYCMPRPPCPDDMVVVANVACAYPCAEPSDCDAHGMKHCATNTLADITNESVGWCTP